MSTRSPARAAAGAAPVRPTSRRTRLVVIRASAQASGIRSRHPDWLYPRRGWPTGALGRLGCHRSNSAA